MEGFVPEGLKKKTHNSQTLLMQRIPFLNLILSSYVHALGKFTHSVLYKKPLKKLITHESDQL